MRQVIEDELRKAGVRLRDFDVPARARPAGVGAERGRWRATASRSSRGSAVEAELAAGTLARRASRARPRARDLPRPRGAARTRPAPREAFVAFARERLRVIVRWGLERAAAGARRARDRAAAARRERAVGAPSASRTRRAGPRCRRSGSSAASDVDGVLALGGGSAIDTAKAISAEAGLPSSRCRRRTPARSGRTYFGVRDPGRKMRGGGGGAHIGGDRLRAGADARAAARARRAARRSTRSRTARRRSTSKGTRPRRDERALEGARADRATRCRAWSTTRRPRGAHAAARGRDACRRGARRLAGSRSVTRWRRRSAAATALPHGALNAICLPPALRFNAGFVPDAVRRFGEAIGATDDPAARGEELARARGSDALRDLGVPEEDLPRLGATAAARAGSAGEPAARDAGGSDRAAPFGVVKRLSDDLPPVSM